MSSHTNHYFDDFRVYADSYPARPEAVAPPDNALWVAPPPESEVPAGHVSVARPDKSGWDIVPDHREGGAYDQDGQWRRVERPGELPDGWTAEPPAPEPEDENQARRREIIAELDALDARYLTPRTLAGLATGDPEARARLDECNALKAPLKAALEEVA